MSVLVDLASRDGSPTIDSPTPYEGLGEWFREKTANAEGDMLKKLSQLRDTDDFDAKAICVQPGTYVKQNDKSKPYLKYFEGGVHNGVRQPPIDVSWVKRRLSNMMFNIRNQKGGFKTDKKSFKIRSTIPDEESGVPIDSAEMLTTPRTCSELDVLEYRVKLPYLVKRLHNYGKSKGVHVMSLIIAHEKAKLTYCNDSKHNITNQDLYPNVLDTYQDGDPLYVNGEPVYLNKNKGPFQSWGFLWVTGRTNELRDDYYDDMKELVLICHRLGIDLTKEDPTKYTNELMDKITVTYIKSNKEYISKMVMREIDIAEYADLYAEDKVDQDIEDDIFEVKSDESDIYTMFRNREAKFLLNYDSRIAKVIDEENNTEKIDNLLLRYKVIGEDVPSNTGKLYTENGFFRNTDGSPLLLNANYLMNKERPVQDYICAVHSSGLLLLITNKTVLEVLRVERAIAYLTDLMEECKYDGKKASALRSIHKHYINGITQAYGSYNEPYGTWMKI